MTDKPDTKFDGGGVWELPGWSIQYDADACTYAGTQDGKVFQGDGVPCPHARGIHDDPPRVNPANPPWSTSSSTTVTTHWVVPRVVVATNESGFATTGVCLDCILEAAATLDGKDVA